MEQTQEIVEQIFTKYLKEHSLRKTPERFAILDRIYSIKGHFDIDDLHAFMRENNYHVSRATLYNTIDLLVDCNLVIKHQFGKNNISTFEKAHDKGIHHHFICMACGNVKEFSDANIKHAVQSKKINNFNISHYTLYIYGTCGKCKKGKTVKK